MATQFADDFKGYGTDASLLLNGLYGAHGGFLVEDPDPNVTGVVFFFSVDSLSGNKLRRVFSGSRATAGIALRFWLGDLPPSNTAVPGIGFLDGSTTRMVYWVIDSIGRISVRTGAGTTLGTTTAPVVTANAWNHIEFKAEADETVGTYEIRVNGVPVLDGVGNTGAGYFQMALINPAGVGTTTSCYVKDLVVWDGLGGQNDDFFGTVSVVGRDPDSDVAFNWAASTGTTGFNLLDNSPPLDGSEYITAINPPPDPSVFGLSGLPSDVTSVRALITQVRARKIDGGDGTLQIGLVSGADTDLGADRPVTTAFTYYEDIFETDPATDAAWTVVAAEAAQLQVDRTT